MQLTPSSPHDALTPRRRRALWKAAGWVLALAVAFLPAGDLGAQKKRPRRPKKQPAGKRPKKQTPKKKKADDKPELFTLKEMLENHLPTVKELLDREKEGGQRLDWIVMKNGSVYVVHPVSPRPDTLEKIQQRIDESKKWPRPKTEEERQEQNRRRSELGFLPIYLHDGGAEPEAKIYYTSIEKILHHEDLLLIRIRMLQESGDLPLAFELLFKLKRAKPGWPTLGEAEKRQLLAEAANHIRQKQDVDALVKLEELHDRDAQFTDEKFPAPSKLMGEVVDRLASAALRQGDFRRARHYLGRLMRIDANHSVYRRWADDLQKRADKLQRQALDAADAKRHDEAARLIARAVDVWPAASGLQASYDELTNRFQRIAVGVFHLPGEVSPFIVPTLADERRRFLTETPLFEARRLDEVVEYGTQYFRDWTPTDLGRTTVFELSAKRPYWQPQPAITAMDIGDSFRARLDPRSPYYDERLTSYVRSVRVPSPTRLEVRFFRVPPRLESVFRQPLVRWNGRRSGGDRPAVTSRSGRRKPNRLKAPPADAPTGSTIPASGLLSPRFSPYKPETWTDRRQVYRRHIPEPDVVPDNRYHVAEIEELRFDTPRQAIQALKRGQVQVLAHLRPLEAKRLAEDRRIEVRPYSVPITHAIQFNPETDALRDRELRRALTYALDRKAMLERIVLRTRDGGDPDDGRLVSAPFPRYSYAYGVVRQKEYDITLALALSLTVRRGVQRAHEAAIGGSMMLGFLKRGEKSGWLPKLRMLVAPGDVSRNVAEACVKQWARIGIRVEIVQPGSLRRGEPLHWDLVYRTSKMIDPVVDLWPYLTFERRARVASLKHLPDWLRQELIRVDLSPDWKSATDNLQALHAHLSKETVLIPLWEVDDYIAFRREVQAYDDSQAKPVHTYQNVVRWIARPGYPTNFP